MTRLSFLPLILVLAGATAEAAPARFALVIGNNYPLADSGYEPLQFADDDALRFTEFFESIGGQVELLTGPDAETAARFGTSADRAHLPLRKNVEESLAKLVSQIAQTKDRDV